ncbi:MAG: MATE family efflux transporter [Oscillospiraceae bacterium]|nr:MATE family efflux transporter [Oscillospiraceae bacterium]
MLKKFKAMFGAQDMTVGRPFSCLIQYAIPLLIGNIAQLLYTTTDAAVVGNYMGELGDTALAAIGASMPPFNIFLVLFMGIGSGVTVMVSQYFGAKDYDNLSLSVGNSILMIAVSSVFITAVATPLVVPLLRMAKTPPETIALARTYLTILFLGSTGCGFYNCLSGILRGLGESLFPLIVLLATVLLNIALDICFVAGFGMGVAGAAIATIIAQALAAVVCLIKVLKMRGILDISRRTLKPQKRIMMQIISLGGPNALSMGVMFASTMFVQALVNSMGQMVLTTITVTQRLDVYAVIPSMTFQGVAQTYTGQNIGAGDMERVKQGSKTVFLMCFVFTAVMVVSMLLFGRHMLALFTKTEAIIDLSMGFIRIMVPAYLAMTVSGTWMGVMRGAGDAFGPMWISMVNNVILRVPLAYLIAYFTKSEINPNGHPNSIMLSLLIAMLVGCVISTVYYRAGKWRNKAVTGDKVKPTFDIV